MNEIYVLMSFRLVDQDGHQKMDEGCRFWFKDLENYKII